MISSMSVAAKPLDAYQTETRFGPGYALITSTYAGICSESLYFPEAVVSGTCTNSAGFSDNTCGAYNALMTFEWSRSCSLVYTGDQRDGFGFRDTVQDCLGVTSMIPQEVRERLILMLSAQDATGGAEPEVRPWSHSPGHMPATPASHYRSDDCLTWTTSKFGDGVITRGPDGQTVTTSKFGSGYINRDNQGGTTTTSKFGDGTITRGNGGSTATTAPFGSGYITRGCTTATPASSPAAGNVITLPARK